MIEYPEAVTIARQITDRLNGKRIVAGVRGNAPHKFAFYSGTPEEYAEALRDKRVGHAEPHGSQIIVNIDPGYALVLGCGGERIIYHTSAASLPKKHQLSLQFEDDTYLTVNVQGWGFAQLWTCESLPEKLHDEPGKCAPLSDAFSDDYFNSLFEQLPPDDPRAIKFFIISKPGVLGVGNGYLQDILFRARLHPRRRAAEITKRERRALYKAIRTTLQQAVDGGGRDTERDLFDEPGRYPKLLDSRSAGQPCPVCGTPIEKISFLGGAAYYCPVCQVLPESEKQPRAPRKRPAKTPKS
jgi:formamidopyrimidine-DNA glycosylase